MRENLRAIAFGNGEFVATGSSSTILLSTDGSTWIKGGAADLHGVAHGSSGFVGVCATGGGPFGTVPNIQTSNNGAVWTPVPLAPTGALHGIGFGAQTFMAVGNACQIVSSPNGASWATTTPIVSTSQLNAVAYGNNRFVAVGTAGMILQSGEAADLSSLTCSAGLLAPPFSPGTAAYTATDASPAGSVTVTPTTADPAATTILVRANSGTANTVPSGTASLAAPVSFKKATTFEVAVTAHGATKTYTVRVYGTAPAAPALRTLTDWIKQMLKRFFP